MEETRNECNNCGKENSKFMCPVCKDTYYCSKECQKNDWKRHKKTHYECPICTETKTKAIVRPCCNNKVCEKCYNTFAEKNTRCVLCNTEAFDEGEEGTNKIIDSLASHARSGGERQIFAYIELLELIKREIQEEKYTKDDKIGLREKANEIIASFSENNIKGKQISNLIKFFNEYRFSTKKKKSRKRQSKKKSRKRRSKKKSIK